MGSQNLPITVLVEGSETTLTTKDLTTAGVDYGYGPAPSRAHDLIHTLRMEAEGNLAAARRRLDLEGASVFDDLTADDMGRYDPLAGVCAAKANQLNRDAGALQNHAADNAEVFPQELEVIAERVKELNPEGDMFLTGTTDEAGTRQWRATTTHPTGDVEASLIYLIDEDGEEIGLQTVDHDAVDVGGTGLGTERRAEGISYVPHSSMETLDWDTGAAAMRSAATRFGAGEPGAPGPAALVDTARAQIHQDAGEVAGQADPQQLIDQQGPSSGLGGPSVS